MEPLLRLVEGINGAYGIGRGEFLIGQLPESWPSTVPILEGMQVVGSVVQTHQKLVLLETQLSPEQVHAAYDRALISEERQVVNEVARGRFSSLDGNLTVEACIPDGMEFTDVRLTWRAARDRQNDSQRASGSFERVHVAKAQPPLIPDLTPPLQSFTVKCGISDSLGDSALFRANVEGDGTDTLEHYAQQLARAGWQRSTQRDGQTASCITWRIPRPGSDEWGVLWVLDWPGRDYQKMVVLRVDSQGGPGVMKDLGGLGPLRR
jgi:hypothetical protein